MKDKIRKVLQFIKRDVWRIRARDLSKGKLLIIRPLRIMLLAARGFKVDRCTLRASALTFYFIQSIVPVCAVAFGIAKGFGLGKIMETRLTSALAGHEKVANRIIEFSRSILQNTKGGVLAGIGVVVLLWIVLKVLWNIEKSFNEIWGVKEPRPFVRKLTDYVTVMLIGPILLVISSTATVFFATKVQALIGDIVVMGQMVNLALRLLPYFVIWAFFTFVYIFMPNTKVHFLPALLGGIVAGTMFQLLQWLYVSFQVGITKYSAIYGSFAVLPLFLIWIHFTWLIVLFGGELSFAYQNEETYEFEPDCLNASHNLRMLVALGITHMVVQRFLKGGSPADAEMISHKIGVPIRLVHEMLYELEEADILCATDGSGTQNPGYLPARAVKQLTVAHVVIALNTSGAVTESVSLTEFQGLENLKESLAAFQEAIKASPSNVSLGEI